MQQCEVLRRSTTTPIDRRLAVSAVAAMAALTVATGARSRGLRSATALTAGVALLATYARDSELRSDDLRTELRYLWSLTGSMTNGEPWPAPGGWALGAHAIALTASEFRFRRGRTVVELGPGASTILLHRSLPDDIEMWGVEHDERYVERLDRWFARFAVDDYTLIHAPLRPVRNGRSGVDWYDLDALSKLPSSIDLLVIDGPPNWQRGANSRSPAWAILRDRLQSGALILVDDTSRRREAAMVRKWLRTGSVQTVIDGGSYVLLEVP